MRQEVKRDERRDKREKGDLSSQLQYMKLIRPSIISVVTENQINLGKW
jgi:hypothetical protein